MTGLLTAFLLILFLTSLAYFGFRHVGSGGSKAARLIRRRLIRLRKTAETDKGQPTASPASGRNADTFQIYLEKAASIRQFNRWLTLAGIRMPLSRLLAILTTCALIAGALLAMLEIPLIVILGIIAIIFLAPYAHLTLFRSRYIATFMKLLPNGLSMAASTIEIGHTIESALAIVAKTASQPLAAEFDNVHKEIGLGMPLTDAMRQLYQRIPTTEVKILAAAISIQHKTGGNLGDILKNLERTLRERCAIQREAKALLAESRLSLVIMVAIPFVMMIFQLIVNRQPTLDFAASTAGKLAYGVAFLLIFIGVIVYKRITRLELN